jgi:hypothetical protein
MNEYMADLSGHVGHAWDFILCSANWRLNRLQLTEGGRNARLLLLAVTNCAIFLLSVFMGLLRFSE